MENKIDYMKEQFQNMMEVKENERAQTTLAIYIDFWSNSSWQTIVKALTMKYD